MLSPFHLVQPTQCLLETLDAANRQSSSTSNLSQEMKEATVLPKRKLEEKISNILVEQDLTCTLGSKDANQLTSSIQKISVTNKNKSQTAPKLNCLKDKVTRYESHKDYLTRCIA